PHQRKMGSGKPQPARDADAGGGHRRQVHQGEQHGQAAVGPLWVAPGGGPGPLDPVHDHQRTAAVRFSRPGAAAEPPRHPAARRPSRATTPAPTGAATTWPGPAPPRLYAAGAAPTGRSFPPASWPGWDSAAPSTAVMTISVATNTVIAAAVWRRMAPIPSP